MISRFHRHDGASTVIVAVSLLLLFGAGAIAIDLGAAWSTKRDVIVDTDAAALAAARAAATHGGCTSSAKQAAEEFIEANAPADVPRPITLAEPTQYTCATTAAGNSVTITFDQQAQQTLGGAMGSAPIDVVASSTAEFNGLFIDGLRPFSACATDGPIAAMTPPGAPTTPTRYLLSMQKTFDETGCATYPGGAGTWGFMCFDVNSACNDGLVRDWIDGNGPGFPRSIDLGASSASGAPHAFNSDGGDEDCDLAVAGNQLCWASTGSTCCNGVPDASAVNALIGKAFAILVTDCVGEVNDNGTPAIRADDTCVKASGSNTNAHPYAYAYVEMEGWCTKKNNLANSTWSNPVPSGLTNDDCFDTGIGNGDLVLALVLHGVQASGTPATFFNAQPPRVEMCGVDNDPASTNRCDGVLSN